MVELFFNYFIYITIDAIENYMGGKIIRKLEKWTRLMRKGRHSPKGSETDDINIDKNKSISSSNSTKLKVFFKFIAVY